MPRPPGMTHAGHRARLEVTAASDGVLRGGLTTRGGRQVGRSLRDEHGLLIFGDLVIDVEDHAVRLGSATVPLTPKEFELLCHFAARPGHVWTRRQLVDAVWDYPDVDPRVVTVHVGNLRKKLAAAVCPPGAPVPLIETVWDLGYRLAEPVTSPVASQHDEESHVFHAHIDHLPYIGRERDLEALCRSMESALQGDVRVVLLAEETGTGHIRLAGMSASPRRYVRRGCVACGIVSAVAWRRRGRPHSRRRRSSRTRLGREAATRTVSPSAGRSQAVAQPDMRR